MASASAQGRPPSPTPSQLPPLPGSPTYSMASTANPMLSAFNLPPPPPPRPAHAVLTHADLELSQQAYADLIATAKAYRVALASLSTAASAFGSALESCARLKEARAEPVGTSRAATTASASASAYAAAANGAAGASDASAAAAPAGVSYVAPPAGPGAPTTPSPAGFPRRASCTADLLMSASGVHQLIANHQQILSETVYRSFEVPLLHELDKWRHEVGGGEEAYRAAVQTQSREIRRMEKDGLKLHRQKRRDLARFRAHLVDLTARLDGLTSLHADHAAALLRASQDTSVKILDASCSLVRAEVDIFESLARKGWTGGGLDDLLEKGVDLFASEPDTAASPAGESAKLFSILPPRSILADDGYHRPRPPHAQSDSFMASTYQSLVAVAAAEHQQHQQQQQREAAARAAQDVGTASDPENRQRNARSPLSLRPLRRVPTDVTFDGDTLGAGGGGLRHERDESEGAGAVSLSLSLGGGGGGGGVTEEDDEADEHEHGEYEMSSTAGEDEGHPWRNEGLRRSLSGEIGRDLNAAAAAADDEDEDGNRRWKDDGVE